MTQPTNAQGKLVDKSNNPQIQDRQAAIPELTDSTGGTVGTSLTTTGPSPIHHDIATLNAEIDKLREALRSHGLIAG